MSLLNIISHLNAPAPPAGPPPDPPPGDTALATPYSFDALKSGQTQINLSWTNDPDASSYEIQRKVAGTFVIINSPVAGSTYLW
jgi:hypothetical protein